ncbi:tryptophan synthase alpha chain [Corallococcus terminator]|uniref:Tryptophan synthase alpha chain n=1 Tax=Corallococcus terminator TaxID=2316733 RepID=A0A3A8IFM6_9BACT|nr:tryptophan synthase alpha chain [Corallococcus terminator]RKG78620.1 tryptophan synthase alpha chain [Corallococcus terminator]
MALLGLWVACGPTQQPYDTDFQLLPSTTLCLPMTCASQGLDCGIAVDGCGGTLHCGPCAEGQACGGGGIPNVCGPAPCTPSTCEALGATCGPVPDGCGGVLECGTCAAPEVCGGSGVPHVCAPPACVATTCEALAKNCGQVADGCGGVLECGACGPEETCGGGGAANVCGHAACTPGTCEALGKDCGPVSDGCGGVLECGACGPGLACGASGVANVCAPGACLAATCAVLGRDCGEVLDGCGGTLECGTCPAEAACGGAGKANVCGPGTCVPATCQSLGSDCGRVSDGCGTVLECGGCTAPETCGGAGVANVCGQAPCTPSTCDALGKDCGQVADGCGGTLTCGTCPDGLQCGGGGTANVCGTPSCRPATCGVLGKTCGQVADGCGGTLSCGSCTAPDTCGGTGVPNVCATTEPVCADRDLGSALPVTVKGSTVEANDDHAASCGGAGAPDRGYLWTAPRTGTFTFDTARSAVRSVIAVASVTAGGCGGAELACATGGISYGGGARVAVPLTKGQQVLVTVDAVAGGPFTQGFFELHIDALRPTEAGACFDGMDNDGDRWVDCADTDCRDEPGCKGQGCAHHDLGSALPVTFQGETAASGDGFQGTCGALLQQDRAHLWTAPRAGTYVFDTSPGGDAAAAGNALYVLTGCRGVELGCASHPRPTAKNAPALKLALAQGQTVLVVVDGMAHPEKDTPIRYTLHIAEAFDSEAGHCQDGADNDADGAADGADRDCR